MWLLHLWQPQDSAEVHRARMKTRFLSLHVHSYHLVAVLDACPDV